MGDFAFQYAETLYKTTGYPICITDKDSIIATAGISKRDLFEKPVSMEMEKVMEEKTAFVCTDSKTVPVTDHYEKYTAGVISPIISEGDVLGNVVVMRSGESDKMTDVEIKLANAASMFLAKQMEI